MTITKEQIDQLVSALPPGMNGECDVQIGVSPPGAAWYSVPVHAARRSLYLAAGLTAEGARKPERVRCYLYTTCNGKIAGLSTNFGVVNEHDTITPGWFVPDGAE